MQSHAGWWRNFCDKHLISADPAQYDEVDTAWLTRELQKLCIKSRWKPLDKYEAQDMKIIKSTLNVRKEFGTPTDITLIDIAFQFCTD